MTLPTVSPQQIHEAYPRAHQVFYSRPIMFWRRFKRMRNFSHFVDNVHAFFYIVLHRKIGTRGRHCREWVEAVKEDFWNVPIEDPILGNKHIRTCGTACKGSCST
jgi:hypothetical protein